MRADPFARSGHRSSIGNAHGNTTAYAKSPQNTSVGFSGTGDNHANTHGNGADGRRSCRSVLILDLATGDHEQGEDQNTEGFRVGGLLRSHRSRPAVSQHVALVGEVFQPYRPGVQTTQTEVDGRTSGNSEPRSSGKGLYRLIISFRILSKSNGHNASSLISLVQFHRWYNPTDRLEVNSSLAYCLVLFPGLRT